MSSAPQRASHSSAQISRGNSHPLHPADCNMPLLPTRSRDSSTAVKLHVDVDGALNLTGACSPYPFADEQPFSYQIAEDEHAHFMDSCGPPRRPFDFTPPSSSGSEMSLPHDAPRHLSFMNAFVATQSRVLRVFNLQRSAARLLSSVFAEDRNSNIPCPTSIWVLRQVPMGEEDSVWVVFRTHDESSLTLSLLSGSPLAVSPALESDLEPFNKLRRFQTAPCPPVSSTVSLSPTGHRQFHRLRMSSSVSDLQRTSPGDTRLSSAEFDTNSYPRNEFTISSNPPNPRTSFRLGDWICGSPNCAAHNFGRNLACIGCGYPRGGTSPPLLQPGNSGQAARLPSPRFASTGPSTGYPHDPRLSPSSSAYAPRPPAPYADSPTSEFFGPAPPKPPSAGHPLLTPSGRAFASGGKVQNVSNDSLSPCVMYWPDNEPFPEQGQIRPSGLVGVPQPPILNTGNRGPIEHQPGDWICLKCNYLNWRRRKVCQTCFPYAEGNGDSISAAVQAERIALLTSVLQQSQGQQARPGLPPARPNLRSHSSTPPQHQPFYADPSSQHPSGAVYRTQSQYDLGVTYAASRPIYQTSGHQGAQRPPPMTSPPAPGSGTPYSAPPPAPLLPSFLQDIVHSPNESPSSSSSLDLSPEDVGDARGRRKEDRPASSSNLASIWRMDGDETLKLGSLSLSDSPAAGVIGAGRKTSREMLRDNSSASP